MKPTFDEAGNVSVTLPYSGTQVSLRRPKIRDLKAFEAAAKVEGADNVDMLVTAIASLQVSPTITRDEIWDIDADDLEAYGEALKTFDFFARLTQGN